MTKLSVTPFNLSFCHFVRSFSRRALTSFNPPPSAVQALRFSLELRTSRFLIRLGLISWGELQLLVITIHLIGVSLPRSARGHKATRWQHKVFYKTLLNYREKCGKRPKRRHTQRRKRRQKAQLSKKMDSHRLRHPFYLRQKQNRISVG